MFASVLDDSTKRLLEARYLLDLCENNIHDSSSSDKDVILRGAVYVLLYGALEYTITHCVSRTIEILNGRELKLYEVLPSLWGLIYDSDCMRMETAGSNKKWENRYKLFKDFTKERLVKQIESTLFPSSNGNIKEKQLDRVWQTLGLKADMFEPDNLDVKYCLNDLANGRMAIAHGRECAPTVGSRKSYEEIEILYNSISRYISYIVECFKQYIDNEEYLQ